MNGRTVLLACLAVVGARSTAEAMCGLKDWVGTPGGSHVPTRGTLYIHDAGRHVDGAQDQAVPAHWLGSEGTVKQVRISSDVIELSYEGTSGSQLVVDGGGRFILDDRWSAPSAAPRALGYRHNVAKWMCSSTDSLTITLDQQTAAIRARWTFQGRTSEWIVPAHSDARPGSPTEADPVEEVELGKIDCGGTTLPPDELRVGGHLELTAIRVDGTEIGVEDLPPTITSEPLLEPLRDHLAIPMPRDLPVDLDDRVIALMIGVLALALGWRLARNGQTSSE